MVFTSLDADRIAAPVVADQQNDHNLEDCLEDVGSQGSDLDGE